MSCLALGCGSIFLAGGILQEFRIHVLGWDLNIPYHTPPNETILKTRQLWVFIWLDYLYVDEFDVEILIDAVEGPRQDDIILEFDGNLLAHQRFEE